MQSIQRDHDMDENTKMLNFVSFMQIWNIHAE